MAITHTETVTALTIVNNSDNIISEVEVTIKSVDDSDPSVLTIEGTESIGVTTSGITTSTSGFAIAIALSLYLILPDHIKVSSKYLNFF